MLSELGGVKVPSRLMTRRPLGDKAGPVQSWRQRVQAGGELRYPIILEYTYIGSSYGSKYSSLEYI